MTSHSYKSSRKIWGTGRTRSRIYHNIMRTPTAAPSPAPRAPAARPPPASGRPPSCDPRLSRPAPRLGWLQTSRKPPRVRQRERKLRAGPGRAFVRHASPRRGSLHDLRKLALIFRQRRRQPHGDVLDVPRRPDQPQRPARERELQPAVSGPRRRVPGSGGQEIRIPASSTWSPSARDWTLCRLPALCLYQPSVARPSTPVSTPPRIGRSRRWASTPSSRCRCSRPTCPTRSGRRRTYRRLGELCWPGP